MNIEISLSIFLLPAILHKITHILYMRKGHHTTSFMIKKEAECKKMKQNKFYWFFAHHTKKSFKKLQSFEFILELYPFDYVDLYI